MPGYDKYGVFKTVEGRKRGNSVRYMPAQPREDGTRWYVGLPYHRKAKQTEPGKYVAGIGVGLVVHQANDVVRQQGILLHEGGHVIRSRPTEDFRVPDVRDYLHKKSGKMRQYVDFATFKEIGEELFVMAYGGERKMIIEVVTGVRSREAAHQLQSWGHWHPLVHGSVALTDPKRMLLVSASASKTLQTDLRNPDVHIPRILGSKAELRKERKGEMVGDCPIWKACDWEVEYTARGDSQAILVRQFSEHIVLVAHPGEVEDMRADPEDAAKFDNLAVDQGLVPMLPMAA